jgi:hypothetical protein
MNSYDKEYKRMLGEHKREVETFEARKRLWQAAYDMSLEWEGSVYGAFDNWWVTFTPDAVNIERFKELMFKYFHHNPAFTIDSPTGTGESSSSIAIVVHDGDAYLDITLNKRGLSSCKVLTKAEMKEMETNRYICEGGDYE